MYNSTNVHTNERARQVVKASHEDNDDKLNLQRYYNTLYPISGLAAAIYSYFTP